MTLYRIVHTTRYEYSTAVSLCHNEAHLTPRDLPWQRCIRSDVMIQPRPAVRAERKDFYGNHVIYFAVQEPHEILEVTAASEIELSTIPIPEETDTPPWEEVRQRLLRELSDPLLEARSYVLDSPFVAAHPKLREYAAPSFATGQPILSCVRDLMNRIHRDFTYDPQFTTIATPLREVMEHRRGVCQDFAHLGIGCLRSMGLAARYVSGYLETLPPPGKPRLVGADASHAWIATFLPDHGWIDFDPTNDRLPTNAHFTVAWGRDYGDVTPLKGVILGGGSHTLKVSVDAERLGPKTKSPATN